MLSITNEKSQKNYAGPKKIILIEHLNEIGGASRVSISLVHGLSDRFDFHVIIPSGQYLQEFEDGKTKVYKMSYSSFRPSLMLDKWVDQISLVLEIRSCVRKILKDKETAVIHINGLPNILPAIATRFLGLPTVWHVHETAFNPNWAFRLLTCFACSISNSVIAVSNSTAEDLIKNILFKSQANKIKVVYNSAFSSIKSKETDQKNIIKSDNTFIVAMAARIVPQKGIIEFLKIAQKTTEQSKNIEFWLAGPKVIKHNKYFQSVISVIEDDSSKQIKYMGELSSCEYFFKMSDIVVNTSLSVESFGLTLVEAMSLGKPVIGPPYGGPGEIISNNENGLVIDPKNTLLFSNTIIELSKDSERLNRLGQAGFMKYKNSFSQENFFSSFSSEYSTLLE